MSFSRIAAIRLSRRRHLVNPSRGLRWSNTNCVLSTLSFGFDQPNNSRTTPSFSRNTGDCFQRASGREFSSPSFTTPGPRRKRKFIPRKAAVQLTEKARNFFKALLENSPDKAGIMLNYEQASSGQPRMVFTFSFVTKDQVSEEDEGVSLEVLEDGSPKSPRESLDDGLPKLYIHHNAFLKVLSATVDVNTEKMTLILYDREGNIMDPNA